MIKVVLCFGGIWLIIFIPYLRSRIGPTKKRVMRKIAHSSSQLITLGFLGSNLYFFSQAFLSAQNIDFWRDRWMEVLLPYPLTGFYFSWIGIGCLYFTKNSLLQASLFITIIMSQSLVAIFSASLVLLWRHREYLKLYNILSIAVLLTLAFGYVASERRVDVKSFRCIDRVVLTEIAVMGLANLDFSEVLRGGGTSIDVKDFFLSSTCEGIAFIGLYEVTESFGRISPEAYGVGNLPIVWLHNDFFRIFYSTGLLGVCVYLFTLYWTAVRGFALYWVASIASLLNPIVYTAFSFILVVFCLIFILARVGDD